MKLPRYPLIVVREQREAAQEAAQKGLAARLEEESAVRDELARLEAEEQELAAALDQIRARVYDPLADGSLDLAVIDERHEEVKFREADLDRHRERRVAQEAAVRRAEEAVEAARLALLEATKELKAIEKHHQRWRGELLLEQQRKEAKVAEEITTSNYVRSD